MSYAMYGIDAFNEQEADTICKAVGFKVAEIQQIIDSCDDDVRPIVERRLRQAYPTGPRFETLPAGLGGAAIGMPNLLERQRQEFSRARPAALGRCTNPLFSGIFGSIL